MGALLHCILTPVLENSSQVCARKIKCSLEKCHCETWSFSRGRGGSPLPPSKPPAAPVVVFDTLEAILAFAVPGGTTEIGLDCPSVTSLKQLLSIPEVLSMHFHVAIKTGM